jgi:hypothetical protein
MSRSKWLTRRDIQAMLPTNMPYLIRYISPCSKVCFKLVLVSIQS